MVAPTFGEQAKEENTTTVLGCIQRSSENYMIVDSHGSSYLLTGVGDQLVREVGHTLEVKGTLVDETQPSRKYGDSFDESHNGIKGSLRVANVESDVHRVGDRCASH